MQSLAVLGAWLLLAMLQVPVLGQQGVGSGDWRFYGGDAGSTRYSALDLIDRDNVKDLQIAWRWKADNFGARPQSNYEVTPLMVNGVLYATAGSRRAVVAIDAATGETLWVWRTDEGERGFVAPRRNHRGVAYWTDGEGNERIFVTTPGYRLVALNAKTGQTCPDFGKDGFVDLYEGLDRPVPKDGVIGSSSPPIVSHDVVVVGAALESGEWPETKENVAGHVRGFDPRTGKRLWIFHTIPVPGEFGSETWENDSWAYTGNTGVWAPMSVDEELGYVYLPVETPTGDYYGGHRHGDNVFAESLVCLDIRTGERIWHFQLVHHGVWDWDLPSAPILADATVDGRRVKAVVQVTKQGWAYVFDRVTGQPVWPIVERPVLASDVPGERVSPTQPFPTRPAAFDRQGMTLEDVIDFTPEVKAAALEVLRQYRIGPIFTPPSLYDENGKKGTVNLPHALGGANWPGGAVDPETSILYVQSVTNPCSVGLVHDPRRSNMRYVVRRPDSSGARAGEGEAQDLVGMESCAGGRQTWLLPVVKPPWGRITAIDLNTGEHVWMIPNGDTPDHIKNHPALKGVDLPRTGKPDRGGLLVTKTLLFAGEGSGLFFTPPGSGGPMFRAIDKQTGAIVSEFELPANQTGLPMTYLMNGKQYIVVAVGARGVPSELVALTVP